MTRRVLQHYPNFATIFSQPYYAAQLATTPYTPTTQAYQQQHSNNNAPSPPISHANPCSSSLHTTSAVHNPMISTKLHRSFFYTSSLHHPRFLPKQPGSVPYFHVSHNRPIVQTTVRAPQLANSSPAISDVINSETLSGPPTLSAQDLEARLIPGKAIARAWMKDLTEEALELREILGRPPGLAVVQVGSRQDSKIYVRNKAEACKTVGISFEEVSLPEDVSQEHLESHVASVCARPDIDGVLIQLPLPPHLDEESIMLILDPQKDVDGFHPLNMGRVLMRGIHTRFIPCTPLGCMHMLLSLGVDIVGKRAVIIGDSNIVGTPMAMLLRDQGAGFVTVCHRAAYASWFGDKDVEERIRAYARACAPRLPGPSSKTRRPPPHGLRTKNVIESQMAHVARGPEGGGGSTLEELGLESTLREVTRQADIVVVAVGIPMLVRKEWVKPGAVVLDVGINVVPTEQVRKLEGGEEATAQLHNQTRQLFQVNGAGDGQSNNGKSYGSSNKLSSRNSSSSSSSTKSSSSSSSSGGGGGGSSNSGREGYTLVGDVALKEVLSQVSYVTPVPGGVGPTTIAALVHNVVQAARYRAGIEAF